MKKKFIKILPEAKRSCPKLLKSQPYGWYTLRKTGQKDPDRNAFIATGECFYGLPMVFRSKMSGFKKYTIHMAMTDSLGSSVLFISSPILDVYYKGRGKAKKLIVETANSFYVLRKFPATVV